MLILWIRGEEKNTYLNMKDRENTYNDFILSKQSPGVCIPECQIQVGIHFELKSDSDVTQSEKARKNLFLL